MTIREQLIAYSSSDAYPFHMPGHKRNPGGNPDPCTMDITEIHGFDDLHHAEGILKEAQEKAAGLYGAKETYFLVNGSTAGNLSALFAALPEEGSVLLARNCHRSVYHAALLRRAKISYVVPPLTAEGIYGSVTPESIEEAFKAHPEIKAVFLTSPTYEGVISDIPAIAKIVHEHQALLLVDEAHGAHLGLAEGFPQSSVTQGADISVMSLHKTMPSLTQTALIHCNADEAVRERLRFYLRVFQTSSPSYVLMASIDDCICRVIQDGPQLFGDYRQRLSDFEDRISGQAKPTDSVVLWRPRGNCIYKKDPSKLILVCRHGITGIKLVEMLREQFHLELEMAGAGYAIAMTSVMDSEEGFDRLAKAVSTINANLAGQTEEDETELDVLLREAMVLPGKTLELTEAFEGNWSEVDLEHSQGKTSAEFVYIYPPGTPLLVPGERIEDKVVQLISYYRDKGYSVQGLNDENCRKIRVTE